MMETEPVGREGATGDGFADPWLLRLAGVSFSYPDGTRALERIDLQINIGEVVALIGPSGCGKSTLVATISGLQRHVGSIQWSDDALADVDEARRRRLSVVFQRNTVMPWMSVEKNVGFGLRFLDLSREERRRRIGSLLTMTGLQETRRSLPHQLSGGMTRRVALATGIAPQPKLLILDEPFAALDEPTRVGLHADVLRLARELNMAILLITHDLSEAVSLADKVCVLSKRPARVVSTVRVPLARDRDVTKIRSEPGYQEIYTDLWRRLWREIQVAEP
jgi:NitT/TauT family transport system ATP-binding protein